MSCNYSIHLFIYFSATIHHGKICYSWNINQSKWSRGDDNQFNEDKPNFLSLITKLLNDPLLITIPILCNGNILSIIGWAITYKGVVSSNLVFDSEGFSNSA